MGKFTSTHNITPGSYVFEVDSCSKRYDKRRGYYHNTPCLYVNYRIHNNDSYIVQSEYKVPYYGNTYRLTSQLETLYKLAGQLVVTNQMPNCKKLNGTKIMVDVLPLATVNAKFDGRAHTYKFENERAPDDTIPSVALESELVVAERLMLKYAERVEQIRNILRSR